MSQTCSSSTSLSIYDMWKKIKKQYKNNKLKIVAPTWSDEFEFVSDIQDYIEYIIKVTHRGKAQPNEN